MSERSAGDVSGRARASDVEQKGLAVAQAAERAAKAAERAEGEQSDHEIAALRHALALTLDALGVPPPRADYP